jgi:aspartate/methionine/tyrosine aminotransferase
MTLYFWLGLFLIIGYFVVTDSSLATFLVLTQKRIELEYEKLKWWILNNPNNPIVKYIVWKRSMKLAEELRKELNEKNR